MQPIEDSCLHGALNVINFVPQHASKMRYINLVLIFATKRKMETISMHSIRDAPQFFEGISAL